jgi:hypothetical protein
MSRTVEVIGTDVGSGIRRSSSGNLACADLTRHTGGAQVRFGWIEVQWVKLCGDKDRGSTFLRIENERLDPVDRGYRRRFECTEGLLSSR